jgi:NitT/TauT family transport system substrate-binding protein
MARLKAAVTHAAVVCAAIFAVTGASTFNAAAEDTVNVRFSWKMKGEYCQFYLAQEMGFFRDAGLNVRMGEGAGAPAALGALLQGQEDVVILQGIFAVSAIQKKMPIKIAALYIPKVGVAVISHPEKPVRVPKDMEGKSIAVAVGDTGTTYLSTFAAKNGLNYSNIKRIQIDAQTRAAVFLQHKVDMFTGFYTNDLPALEGATMQKFVTMNMAEHGLVIPGLAVIASDATIAKRGPVLGRYLAAVNRGIEATRKDEGAAVRALMKSWSNAPAQEVVAEQCRATIREMTTAPGHPTGWTDPNLITSTLDLLSTDENIGTPRPTNVFYTNDLLPK